MFLLRLRGDSEVEEFPVVGVRNPALSPLDRDREDATELIKSTG